MLSRRPVRDNTGTSNTNMPEGIANPRQRKIGNKKLIASVAFLYAAFATSAILRNRNSTQTGLYKCTHEIFATPKSGSTATARALCHLLQDKTKASCLHEPRRVQSEAAFQGLKSLPNFELMSTSLCKDMIVPGDYYGEQHEKKIKKAIDDSKNTLVFIKNSPLISHLSSLNQKMKYYQEQGNLGGILVKEQEISNLMKMTSLESMETSKMYEKIKVYAQVKGKDIIEITQKDLNNNPRKVFSEVISSWGHKGISNTDELKLSPVINLSEKTSLRAYQFEKTYQMNGEDAWDTVRGDTFQAKEKNNTIPSKIESILNAYVPYDMHEYFSSVLKKDIEHLTQELEQLNNEDQPNTSTNYKGLRGEPTH